MSATLHTGEAYAKERGVRKDGFYKRSPLARWGRMESLGDLYPSSLRSYSRSWRLSFPNYSKWQPRWNRISKGSRGRVRREESPELARSLRKV